jgi:hypothetical protein
LARNDRSPRRRFHDHPLIEGRQGARFNDLPGGQIGRAHLDGVGAEQAGHKSGFPIEDAPRQDHPTVLEQGWMTTFEVQHHLRQGERAMLPYVAAGLVALANHVADARFQGELQQGLIRGDIHDADAALQQFFYGGEISSGDPDKTGSVLLYPGQMRFPEWVLGQGDDIHCVRACAHDLRQAYQPAITGLGIHQAEGDGGQSAGIGNLGGKLRGFGDRGHGALDKGVLDAHLPGYGAVQEAILLRLGCAAQVPHLRHEGVHGLLGSGAKTLGKRRGKGRLHAQRDDLALGEMAVQGMESAGLHLADEGATAFVRDPGGAQRILERLNLFEGQRVPLVEKATRNLQVQAHKDSGIHAESGELLALGIVHDHQIGQPVDTLEDDTGGSGGQEGRGRLGGGDAAPDEDVQRLRRGVQHFLGRRIEDQGRLAAHESGGLAALEDDAPGARILLDHGGQERHVPDDGKAAEVFRQGPQSLQKCRKIPRGELGRAFYPEIPGACFLQEPADGWIHQGGGGNLDIADMTNRVGLLQERM